MNIKEIFKKALKIIFWAFLLFIIFRFGQLVNENYRLQHKVDILTLSKNTHLQQLEELIFIMKHQGENIDKEKLYKAIYEFGEIHRQKAKECGIDIGEFPILSSKSNKISGYTDDLKYIFNDENILKDIAFSQFHIDD